LNGRVQLRLPPAGADQLRLEQLPKLVLLGTQLLDRRLEDLDRLAVAAYPEEHAAVLQGDLRLPGWVVRQPGGFAEVVGRGGRVDEPLGHP